MAKSNYYWNYNGSLYCSYGNVKNGGLAISCLLIIYLTILCIVNPPIYSTNIIVNGEKYRFNDSYKVYLVDKKYGNLKIKYEEGIEDWVVYAEFKKAGKTEFVIESPDGKKSHMKYLLGEIHIL